MNGFQTKSLEHQMRVVQNLTPDSFVLTTQRGVNGPNFRSMLVWVFDGVCTNNGTYVVIYTKNDFLRYCEIKNIQLDSFSQEFLSKLDSMLPTRPVLESRIYDKTDDVCHVTKEGKECLENEQIPTAPFASQMDMCDLEILRISLKKTNAITTSPSHHVIDITVKESQDQCWGDEVVERSLKLYTRWDWYHYCAKKNLFIDQKLPQEFKDALVSMVERPKFTGGFSDWKIEVPITL